MAGTTSGTATTPIAGVWQRLSWTYTTPATTSYFGFRVASPVGAGSFLITGFLIEKSGFLGDYFDGTGPNRKNLATDGRATTYITTSGQIGWKNTRWFGGGNPVGTYTTLTNILDGPVPGITSYARKTWTNATSPTHNGDTGFDHTVTNMTVVPGEVYSFTSWLRPSSSGKNMQHSIYWYDASNNLTRATGATINNAPAATWSQLTSTVTVPAGMTKMTLASDVGSGTLWVQNDTLDGTGLIIERIGTPSTIYYDGTGDFAYAWNGVANASASLQTATSVPAIGGANNSITYRSGLTGAYVARTIFTSDAITDSGPAFQGTIPTVAASKTYTLSLDVWVDRDRTYRLSVQGAGTTNTTTTFTQTANTTVRRSITFQTNASATGPANVALYLLRSDLLAGYIDVSKILVEEGSIAGAYFDGGSPIKNYANNPSLEANSTSWGFYGGTSGASSVARIAGTGYSGPNYWRGTYTASQTGAHSGGGYGDATIVPGLVYSAFMAVRPSRAQAVNITIEWVGSNRSIISRSSSALYNLAGGVWNELRLDGQQAPVNAVTARVTVYASTISGTAWQIGDTIDFDGLAVTQDLTAGIYVESGVDLTYGWTGVANGSTSTIMGLGLTGWAGAIGGSSAVQSVIQPMTGSKCAMVKTQGSNGDGIYNNDVNVTAGEYYSFSAWIKLTSVVPSLTGVMRWKDSAGTFISEQQSNVSASLIVGQWVRVSMTGIAPANTSKVSIMWRIYMTHTPTVYYVDGVNLVQLPYDVPHFDGSTSAAGDISYAWVGQANNSASIMRGTGVAGLGQMSSGPAIQSSEWSASGTKSIRIFSNYRGFDTYTTLGGDGATGVMRLGMQAGMTYTLVWKTRLSKTLTNIGTQTRWGRPVFFATNPQGLYIETPLGTAPTNAPGVYPNRDTFTVPATATQTFIRLYNGTSGGDNGEIWYDDLMLVEGTYQGDFLNPDQNAFVKWDGTAHASTSVGYYPVLGDFAGTPKKDLSVAGAIIPNTSPANDLSARTVYLCYESYGMTQSYNSLGGYGQSGFSRITFQTQPAGQNQVGCRLDFTGGEFNRVMILNGGRTAGARHIIAINVNPSAGTASACLNGGADITLGGLNVGPGWEANDYTFLGGVSADQKGVRMLVFNADHDRATRLAISRYLGNKYGVPIP